MAWKKSSGDDRHEIQNIVPEGNRRCPICSMRMEAKKKSGISIDVCEKHGIWLDKGELPAIMEKMRSKIGTSIPIDAVEAKRLFPVATYCPNLPQCTYSLCRKYHH